MRAPGMLLLLDASVEKRLVSFGVQSNLTLRAMSYVGLKQHGTGLHGGLLLPPPFSPSHVDCGAGPRVKPLGQALGHAMRSGSIVAGLTVRAKESDKTTYMAKISKSTF